MATERSVEQTSRPELDVPPGVRRVHHLPVADVEADVTEAVEEEDVAGLEVRRRDAPALAVQRVRAVRELDADAPVRPAHETRAVEAVRGGLTAPAVRSADRVDREVDGLLALRRRIALVPVKRRPQRPLAVVHDCERRRGQDQQHDHGERADGDEGAEKQREKECRLRTHDTAAREPGLSGIVGSYARDPRCRPLGGLTGANREHVDELAQHARVHRELVETRPRPPGDLVGEPMLAAMAHYKDEETFRWFQTSIVNSRGEPQATDTLRVSMGQARREVLR
jgi:hypothetical protein